MRIPRLRAALAALTLATLGAASADAQTWIDRAKQKAKEKAAEAIEKKPEKKADSTARRAPRDTIPTAGTRAGAAPAERPGEGAWANYDFKPGDRILYADDFTRDEVGDFPRRMEFKSGALEIVEWKGGRYLRATEKSQFYVVLPEPLPERFTLEFDYVIPAGEVWIFAGDDESRRIDIGGRGATAVRNDDLNVTANSPPESGEQAVRFRRARLLVDGKYVKVYLDDRRTLNVPNADLKRANKLKFYTDADPENPALFGNFRVAAGGRKLYDALAESGRVATQGIYFDTGSDRIRPESTPTLKEIGAMLTEHPDLRLTIEGHTDDVGQPAANQTLSEKRAEAVKAFLVGSYGIDAGRVAAAGFGATRPAVPNATPEGRQQNRRVELVRM